MSASLDTLQPFVEEILFTFDVKVERKSTHYCFHLDYQEKKYRQEALASVIRDSVVYFALTHEEFERFRSRGDFAQATRTAWSRISKAVKTQKGDYGELLLYLILSFKLPQRVPRFVTKVRLRSSRGDQIKGFDCAHFTIEDGEPCLWLGEAKFYQSMSGAIAKTIESLEEHWKASYLTDELKILGTNIEANHGIDESMLEQLDRALNKGRSIDRLKFRVPILLTYDSKSVQSNTSICDTFKTQLETELESHFKALDGFPAPPANFSLLFVLIPFQSVSQIKTHLENIEQAML